MAPRFALRRLYVGLPVMSLQEIEKAIGNLTPQEFADLRAHINKIEFESEAFDAKIAADFQAGKLDSLMDRALDEDAQNQTEPVP